MFIPFYEDRSKFDVAAELFADTAWVVGYVIGFAIALTTLLYDHFTAKPVEQIAKPLKLEANRDTLRQQCQAAGIRWNRAGHGGKHLTKQEMIQKLSEANVCYY